MEPSERAPGQSNASDADRAPLVHDSLSAAVEVGSLSILCFLNSDLHA